MKNSKANVKILKGRIEVLQGVRTVAFLLIYISHCDIIYNQHNINIFTWLGALGVSMFLILSGYLNGNKYLNRKDTTYNYVSLFVNKIKKVCPLHIVTLIASLPLSIGFLFSGSGVLCLALNMLMVQSYIPSSIFYFSYNAVSWYLGVYLLCILLNPICRKDNKYIAK